MRSSIVSSITISPANGAASAAATKGCALLLACNGLLDYILALIRPARLAHGGSGQAG